MTKKKFVVLTSSKQLIPDNKSELTLLNYGVKNFSLNHIWSKNRVTVLKSPLSDPKKLHIAHDEIMQIFPEFLNILKNKLNRIHSVSQSQDYWNVLLGSWAISYISVVYYRFNAIQNLSKIIPDWETELLTEDSFVVPNNYTDYLSLVMNSDEYNHQLYTQIIAFLGFKFEKKKVVIDSKHHHKINPINPSFKVRLINSFNYILVKFANIFSNRVVFLDIYIPYKLLFKSFFKSKGRFVIYKPKKSLIRGTSVNHDLRKCLLDNNPEELHPLIKLLVHLLPQNLPKAFLEDFKYYESYVKCNFPKHPASVFTSTGLYSNEYTRFWLAQLKMQGVPLGVFQHGGVYGTARYTLGEFLEVSFSNYFYSWGWQDSVISTLNNKVVPSFMFHSKKIQPMKHAKKILFTININSRYFFRLNNTNYFNVEFLLNSQFEFIDNLSHSLHESLIIRNKYDFGWGIKDQYYQRYPKIKFESMGDISLEQSLYKTKIIVLDHCSTIMLEAFKSNIPTVLFWDPNIEKVRNEIEAYFDELVKVGILHYSPESAAETLNTVYSNVEKWWANPKRQAAVSKFRDKFAKVSQDEIKDLFETIKNAK
ncbi:MAG: LIC12162 family transferase [Candidatus Marinamargulisbacteria bacterium]